LVHLPVELGGVEAVANQRRFEQTLDWSANFTDHGVVVLQHDVYVEAVDLAIGQTLPWLLQHNPPFDIKPIMQCQGRPIEDAYVETNTNPDSPAFSGKGDIATRTSNLGYAGRDQDDITEIASRTYVSPSGYQTSTSSTNASSDSTSKSGTTRTPLVVGVTVGILGAVLVGVAVVYYFCARSRRQKGARY
jgi:hypothetical protein